MSGDTLDDAISYVRSVAFSKPGREGYWIDSIMAELATYQRTDGETYAEFAARFLTPDEILREWRETAARASKVRRRK